MDINSYSEALAYFYSYTNYNPADASNWSLERLQGLLARLENPHQRFPSLLIAGTKGKGSTAAICESILRQAGYKTGLFTSPHLHSFRERIRLSGELISEEKVVALANRLKPFFEATPGLTAFELITTVAFVAFSDANIEAAVLEVGLGGRLDATNAVDPDVAVITPISYDHTQILGETLTLIAREKAGIIRPGALVISAPQVDEAMQMIESVCQEHQARLVVVDREWKWQMNPGDLSGESFTIWGQSYRLPLIGRHQVVNAVTAMAAVTGFAERTGLEMALPAVQAGIAQVKWPGRMEILHQHPYLIIDSAMNGDSAQKLALALGHYFPGKKFFFICGASSDHPIRDMLTALLPVTAKMFMVRSRHPRAADPVDLMAAAAELGYETQPVESVPVVLEQVLAEAQASEVICVTGSLFLAADVREVWLRRNNLPLPPIDPIITS